MVEGAEVKAVTIRQPYAWMIVEGLKQVEWRTWRPRGVEWVAIHAGLIMEDDAVPLVVIPPKRWHQGYIVGIMHILGYVGSEGNWGWVIDAVQEIRPVRCKGNRGIWDVDPDVVAKINASKIKGE